MVHLCWQNLPAGLSKSAQLRGYCTSGPYVWRLCAFSQKIKQLWTKYPIDLVRNLPRNSKIGSGGIEKSHSCKWAKWIQWHALPHIQQSTQQRNKGYYPNLHGWDFSIPPSPKNHSLTSAEAIVVKLQRKMCKNQYFPSFEP